MYGKCKRKPQWEFPQSCPACPGQHRRAASGRHQSPRKWRKQLLVVETVEVAELGKKIGKTYPVYRSLSDKADKACWFLCDKHGCVADPERSCIPVMDHWGPLVTMLDHLGPASCDMPWPMADTNRLWEDRRALTGPLADLSSKSSESHWTHKTHESHGNIWQHMATYGN